VSSMQAAILDGITWEKPDKKTQGWSFKVKKCI